MQTVKKERQASEQIIESTEIQVFIGGFEFLVVDSPATSDVCVPHPLDIMSSPLENIELTGHRYLSQRLQRIINNQRCEIHNLRIEVDENSDLDFSLRVLIPFSVRKHTNTFFPIGHSASVTFFFWTEQPVAKIY